LAIGPTLGGWLIQTVGWRSVFLLIVPIGLAVLLWAPRAIPESRDAQGRRVDLPGQLFGGLAWPRWRWPPSCTVCCCPPWRWHCWRAAVRAPNGVRERAR
jgi:Arabinose efflux permease